MSNTNNNKPKKKVRIPKRLREAKSENRRSFSSYSHSPTSSKHQPNVGWKFYFDYYRGVDYSYLVEGKLNDKDLKEVKQNNAEILQKQNKALWNLDFNAYPKTRLVANTDNCFTLKTTYPGLLVGSGYQHELSSEDALKLGFYFDHTTGLPALPGSGIKGTLRNAFGESWEFIQELLQGIDSSIQLDEPRIKALEKEIFEGVNTKESKKDNIQYLYSSQRDVFYDAVMVSSEHPFPNSNRKGRFLANDYITPPQQRERQYECLQKSCTLAVLEGFA